METNRCIPQGYRFVDIVVFCGGFFCFVSVKLIWSIMVKIVKKLESCPMWHSSFPVIQKVGIFILLT